GARRPAVGDQLDRRPLRPRRPPLPVLPARPGASPGVHQRQGRGRRPQGRGPRRRRRRRPGQGQAAGRPRHGRRAGRALRDDGGVKAALALDPAEAAKVEGTRSPGTADVEVVVQTHAPGTPLAPLVVEAANGDKHVATFLAADPAALGPALDTLSDLQIGGASALLVASRGFDEAFLRSSKIGRRGDVKIFGEVAPDSGESLLYTKLVFTIFPGEQPSIDGLRGYMAGKAIATVLDKGASAGALAEHLKLLTLFS